MTLTNCNSEAVCAAPQKTDNIHEIFNSIEANVNAIFEAIGRLTRDIDVTLVEAPVGGESNDMKSYLSNMNDMTRFAARKLNEIAGTIGC